MTKGRSWRLFLPVLAAGVLLATTAFAQSSGQQADSSTNSFVHVYDLSKEVKITGTIQKIETSGAVPIGTHVLVQTAQGTVDAHVGFGEAAKPSYLGIADGQSVTLVGMMENFDGNQILLARLLTTSNHIFVLRNEHGIPVRGIPHRGTSAAATQKGGL
jgi:hypothetical protein